MVRRADRALRGTSGCRRSRLRRRRCGPTAARGRVIATGLSFVEAGCLKMTMGNALNRPAPDGGAAETNLVTLASILPFLYRNAGTIAVATAIAFLIGVFYVATTPRAYVATAELLIEPKKEPSFWNRQGVIDFTIDNAQVESEIAILRSERVAAAVIGELHLADDPEFVSAQRLSNS